MKKLLTILLVAILSVGCVFSLTACGDEKDNSAKKGLIYTKNDDGYVLYDYVDEGKGVTELDLNAALATATGDANAKFVAIKDGAFEGNNTLTKLVIPASVTKIDAGALKEMRKLEELTIPFVGGLLKADAYPNQFESSTDKATDTEKSFGYIFGTEEYDGGAQISLTISTATTYYIPATLKKVTIESANEYNIPIRAFNGLTQITDIVLGSKVIGIGEEAFANCAQLVSFNIPVTVKTLYKGAFASCAKLENINYAGSATQWSAVTVKEDAFKDAADSFKINYAVNE